MSLDQLAPGRVRTPAVWHSCLLSLVDLPEGEMRVVQPGGTARLVPANIGVLEVLALVGETVLGFVGAVGVTVGIGKSAYDVDIVG